MDTDPSILLVINRNQEMQRIYCCDSFQQLKRHSKDKAELAEQNRVSLDNRAANAVKVDYKFMENQKRLESTMASKVKNA